MSTPARTDIFISYSHADKFWLNRLQVHLKPLERSHKVNIWADTKLRGGDLWEKEIRTALAKTKVAILLISADFLASDFIHNDELPPLLLASEDEGTIILPVILSSCSFTSSGLSKFQAINNVQRPLDMVAIGQQNQIFSQLHSRLLTILSEV